MYGIHSCISFFCMYSIIIVVYQCRDFKAGSALRSNSRFHMLDETALFGSACRHEFPLVFLDLKHGERLARWLLIHISIYSCRLAYAEFLIKELIRRNIKNDSKLYIMYDIACMLKKHLQVTLLLFKFILDFPSFCQIS